MARMQIAVPAFVSTLCICIVFVPVIFLTGAARYLFTPLALAVVLAIMASYLLSRTLVPTMVRYLLAAEVERYSSGEEGAIEDARPRYLRRHPSRVPNTIRGDAGRLPRICWHPRWHIARHGARGFLLALRGLRGARLRSSATDFFPQVDAGQIRLHVRAPAGTRIEETES